MKTLGVYMIFLFLVKNRSASGNQTTTTPAELTTTHSAHQSHPTKVAVFEDALDPHHHARAIPVFMEEDKLNASNEFENDGMIGVFPELFYEDDDTILDWPIGDSVRALLALCRNATKCEECPYAATNSRKLVKYRDEIPPCDVLSYYNYEKLRHAQKAVQKKQEFVYSYHLAIIHAVCFGLLLIMGGYLIVVGQFKVKTLWDKSIKDPTQGMRSFRYERMEFTFDPDDPGAEPDDLKGYEGWTVYNDDEEGESVKEKFVHADVTDVEDGPRIWPWELPGYDFSQIPYREGTEKDMEDWRPDDDE